MSLSRHPEKLALMLLALLSGAAAQAEDAPARPPPGTMPAVAHTTEPAACSPDGEFHAIADASGRIRYGRTHDGATLRTFYHCRPRRLSFSPDGRWLAATGAAQGHPARLKVWRLADGALLCWVETRAGSEPLLSFSPDGRLLASTHEGRQIHVWQLPEGTLALSATATAPVSAPAFSPAGTALIALLADGGIRRFPAP